VELRRSILIRRVLLIFPWEYMLKARKKYNKREINIG
jgi:hypothetical protein